MTSEERREARYQRRKAARQARKQARNDSLGTLAEVFSFRDMFRYGLKCCNGVRWKQSTQNFERHLFSGTARRRREILSGQWKPGKYVHFTLRYGADLFVQDQVPVSLVDQGVGRGREKVVKIHQEHGALPPVLSELFPQLVLQQLVMEMQALSPLAGPVCIDHAGTVQRDQDIIAKGFVDLAVIDVRRVNGADLAALPQGKVDIFPRFPLAGKNFPPPAGGARKQVTVVASVPGGVGMPLGVEPSQQEMVALPSSLDNWLKCQKSIHGAGHYMDDYAGFLLL